MNETITYIKSTGRPSIAQLLRKRRRKKKDDKKIKTETKGEEIQNSIDDKIPKEGNTNLALKREAMTKRPIIFRSCDLVLLLNQRQVHFEKSYSVHTSPLNSMDLVTYDSYPIHLGRNECLIKIEISTISHIDCAIRRNECYDKQVTQPNIPGFCAVGRVIAVSHSMKSEEDMNLFNVGDRIATILFKGGNARFATQSTSRMIKITEKDNGKLVCIILCATMAAFACLQHYVPVSKRYDFRSHLNETIFVNGGMSLVGQAIIRLCSFFGVSKVYATGSPEDFKSLKMIGAIPLEINLPSTSNDMKDQVDTIIDCSSFDDDDYLQKMRNETGRIIFYEYGDISRNGNYGWRSDLHRFILKCKLLPDYKQASFCNPLQEFFFDNFQTFKRDFEFLKDLLKDDKILLKQVQGTIPLDMVPLMHQRIDENEDMGMTIVDPWK